MAMLVVEQFPEPEKAGSGNKSPVRGGYPMVFWQKLPNTRLVLRYARKLVGDGGLVSGLSGAVALFTSEGELRVEDIPTLTTDRDGK